MRSIKNGFRTWVAAVSATGGNVHLDVIEQDAAMPAVCVAVEETENYSTLAGDDGSLRKETFRVSSYGNTSEAADTVANAIADALDALSLPVAMGTDRVAVDASIRTASSEVDVEFAVGRHSSDLMVELIHKPAA